MQKTGWVAEYNARMFEALLASMMTTAPVATNRLGNAAGKRS
jgi:hypothetical protein